MFIRNSFIRKFSAVFLLLIFLTQILGPSVANALTSGPHQPEYTSYEEPGSTDMVNLLTGDFNYSLPLLEIPGPEGGFSVPLSYHSGVGVDQQASWVGLGWSLNVGAIARGVVEYPDDASGESYEIHRSNADIARGWNSNIPGVGQIGWDSNEGHYGTISILGLVGASYKNGGLTGGNLIGVHFSSKKVTVDPAQLVAAVMTIATLGAGGVASSAGTTLGQEVAKQAAIQIAIEAASTLVFGVGAPNFNIGGYWKLSDRKEKKLFHTNYWVWLDQTRYENMYGTLYLGAMDNFNHPSALMPNLKDASGNTVDPMVYVEPKDINDEGATSDISYSWNGEPYYESLQPTHLAKDNYSVMGNGVSGSMSPYRLDVGSVAMPRQMNSTHIKYAVARHINPLDYKVQFKYEGMPSNTYTHHAGGTRDANNESQINLDDPQLGITALYNSDPGINDQLIYDTSEDPSLPEHFTIGTSNVPVEQDRTGLTNKSLSQARDVQWFSNDEIINNDLSASGFMDCMPKAERQSMIQDFGGEIRISISSSTISTNRIWVGKRNAKYFTIGQTVKLNGSVDCSDNPLVGYSTQYMSNFTAQITGIEGEYLLLDQMPCETTKPYHRFRFGYLKTEIQRPVPLSTIGGFVITKEDGRKFHYSQPVYEWGNITYMQNVNDPDDITEMSRLDPFPSTWLLTAITGPDFYDRNENGMVDDTDWGHWIRFDYGKFSSNYSWRSPYKGLRLSSNGESYSYTKGMREQYYLNNIRTRTHTALFIKDLRTDGKSYYTTASNGISSSLFLDEIVLLKNEDLSALTETGLTKNSNHVYSLLSNSDSFDEIWDKNDINTQKRLEIDAVALRKIKLNYSYNLAQNTPNSFSSVPTENQTSFPGKLTLESISFLGNNNFKVLPDYYFEYANNANYDETKWDGWGYYNSSGTSHHQSHKASTLDADGYAWNLNRIITPLGSTIDIEYERDTYSSISGYPVTEGHYFSDKDWNDGILVGNPNAFSVGEDITLDFTVNYSCGSEGFVEKYKVQAQITSITHDRIYIEQTPPFISCMDGSIQPTVNSMYGDVLKTINRKGGDVRVSKITTSNNDDFSASVRYLYSKGVVAKEPDYIKQQDYDFYNHYDFPSTPVVYGKVTVLNGLLTHINDYDVKQVYDFITPHHSMVSSEFDGPGRELIRIGNTLIMTDDYLTQGIHKININTSRIGQLDKITTYDNADNIIATTDMLFAEEIANNESIAHQGVFTEGTLQVEKVRESGNIFHRLFRTTKIIHPSFPVKVITTHNNKESISENLEFDFLTGAPIKVLSLEPNGINILTETVPAYKVYPEMGPIAENPAVNKNMLGQNAASYTYRVDENLAVLGLLSASATVWNNNWQNYRNHESGEYTSSENATSVWRIQSTYGYEGKADELNADGSLVWNDSKRFNHTDPSSLPTWRINETINRYDNFSMPVESYDEDGFYSAVKFDALMKNKVAEASLAKYTEFTFSGAENAPIPSGAKIFLDGETFIDDINKISDTKSHTGTKSLELTASGSKGFQYIVNTSQENFDINQKYISMVWVNKDQAEDVKLYYKYTIGTNTITEEEDNVLKHAGEWTRLSQQINLPQGVTDLEVGVVKNSSTGTAYVDDFKFQPLMASVNAYIQDDKGALTYVLNDENLFSRSEYNDGGQLIATYAERFDTDKLVLGEKKIASSETYYATLPMNELEVSFAFSEYSKKFTASPSNGKAPYLIKWFVDGQLYSEDITEGQSALVIEELFECGYNVTSEVMDGYGSVKEYSWESESPFFTKSGSAYSGGLAEMSVTGGLMPYTYNWEVKNDQGQIVEQYTSTISQTTNIWEPFPDGLTPLCYEITCEVVDNCGKVLNEVLFNSSEHITLSKNSWPTSGAADQEYTFLVNANTCGIFTGSWQVKDMGPNGGFLNIPAGSYDDTSLNFIFTSCGTYEVIYTAAIGGEFYNVSGQIVIDLNCF